MVLAKPDIQRQKNKTRPRLTLLMHINLKWIKYLNIGPKIIKLQEEKKKGEKFLDVGLHNDFMAMTLKAQAHKSKHKFVELH